MVSQIEPKPGWEALGRHGDSELLKTFCYNVHDGRHSSHLEDLLLLAHQSCSFAPDHLMPWSVNHGLSLIRMSVSNFSHFRHLHQNCIHDGHHIGHLESSFVICSRTVSRWSGNLVEGIGAGWKFRIVSSPEQRSGRAIVLPPASALALASTNVKVFVKVFKTSLFPNLITDLIHLWYDDTYWSKILCSTIPPL